MSQYFQLFNLPEQFPLDTQALEQRYRALAAQFHPDKYTTANPFEQKQALMMSATLNQAYAILKSPIDRAAYLLQQHNIHPDDPHNTQIDPEFLMQQMQWRETLAEAQAEQNTPTLQALQNEIALGVGVEDVVAHADFVHPLHRRLAYLVNVGERRQPLAQGFAQIGLLRQGGRQRQGQGQSGQQ